MSLPFFLGGEPSTNPAGGDLVEVAHALAADGAGEGAVSARHGLRATVSASGVPLEAVGPEHFVEIADYDAHLDRVMVLGKHPPSPWAGLHALVYRAKKEVHAIVQVSLAADHPALARLPAAKKGRTTLDNALSILEALRGASAVAFAGRYRVAAGSSPKEAFAAAERALGSGGGEA
jgi:hypothetical protein